MVFSRPVTAVFLPAAFPPATTEALARAATAQFLPARLPPPIHEGFVRSFTIETPGVSLDAGESPPEDAAPALALGGAAPNPFRTLTRIRYSLAGPANVRLEIFDLAGRLVRTLTDGWQAAGDHLIEWKGVGRDNRKVAAGVYLCRLHVAASELTRRIVVLE